MGDYLLSRAKLSDKAALCSTIGRYANQNNKQPVKRLTISCTVSLGYHRVINIQYKNFVQSFCPAQPLEEQEKA